MAHNLLQEKHRDLTKMVVVDQSVRLTSFRDIDMNHRPVVGASLGMHVEGVCLPKPHLYDTMTALDGAFYRFCRENVKMMMKKPSFSAFVKNWLNENLTPLSPDTDVSVESWLERTNYSQKRKEELLRKSQELSGIDIDKITRVKSFVKDEFYPEYKTARAINSRTDEFKVLVGPLFKAIEEKLFSLPYFIKKIPVDERPEYIMNLVYKAGSEYYGTDFTSFESHFVKQLMNELDFQLYDHMTKNLSDGVAKRHLIYKAKTGRNEIVFKNFKMSVNAKKMSGEMDTSLSNGFANLMFILYVLETNGCSSVAAVVEGDDGLFRCEGPPVQDKWFSDFGLLIKLDRHKDISTASFCGMVFDPTDRTIVTDPRKVLATFGWTSSTYARSNPLIHNSLLKCKALSMAYQYPRCPILNKLAEKVLKLTSSVDVGQFLSRRKFCSDDYKNELVRQAYQKYLEGNLVFGEPGSNTRHLVSELYNIPVQDQLCIESYIESISEIGPLNHPVIDSHMSPVWKDFWDKYSRLVHTGHVDFDYEVDMFIKCRKRSDLTSFVKNPLLKKKMRELVI